MTASWQAIIDDDLVITIWGSKSSSVIRHGKKYANMAVRVSTATIERAVWRPAVAYGKA